MKTNISQCIALCALMLTSSIFAMEPSAQEHYKQMYEEAASIELDESMKKEIEDGLREYKLNPKEALVLNIPTQAALNSMVQECVSKGSISSESTSHLNKEAQNRRSYLMRHTLICNCGNPDLYLAARHAQLMVDYIQHKHDLSK